MSTLSRRLRTMERLRNRYDGIKFTTTNEDVTISFKYVDDAQFCHELHKGKPISVYRLTFTMKEFDNLFA